MKNLLSLCNIIKRFGNKTVLDNIDLSVNEGDYISIVGRSGAGKSTLMNIIGLLDGNFHGEYSFRGSVLKQSERNEFRNRHLGFIFQQYNLIPILSARENVMLPYTFYPGKKDSIEQRCCELFEKFGLSEQIDQTVNTLSGGEKQRVALIRSIILEPEIILADEPTGNLDPNTSVYIKDFLKQENKNGKTIIVVTHDLNFAVDAQRQFRIDGGKLYEKNIKNF